MELANLIHFTLNMIVAWAVIVIGLLAVVALLLKFINKL